MSSADPKHESPELALQEANDAALARKLQDEIDREEAVSASQPQQNTETAQREPEQSKQPVALRDGVLSVPCPACTFINNLTGPFEAKQPRRCEQCRTPLPIPDAYIKKKESDKLINCNFCHSANRIPRETADALLCGACYQELGSSVDKDDERARLPEVEAETRTVQIRCGQCSAVNAVQVTVDATIVQFECGGCSTVNEVTLS